MMNYLKILEVLLPWKEIIITFLPFSSFIVRPLPRALIPIVSHPIFSSFHVIPYRWFIFHEFFFYFQN
jgi:hypothetical protein